MYEFLHSHKYICGVNVYVYYVSLFECMYVYIPELAYVLLNFKRKIKYTHISICNCL